MQKKSLPASNLPFAVVLHYDRDLFEHARWLQFPHWLGFPKTTILIKINKKCKLKLLEIWWKQSLTLLDGMNVVERRVLVRVGKLVVQIDIERFNYSSAYSLSKTIVHKDFWNHKALPSVLNRSRDWRRKLNWPRCSCCTKRTRLSKLCARASKSRTNLWAAFGACVVWAVSWKMC